MSFYTENSKRHINYTKVNILQLYYNNHGQNSLVYLSEEEKLAEAMSKFPCVYDKPCENYRNKICVEISWDMVDKEISFEESKMSFYRSTY